MKKWIYRILLLICLGVFCFSAFNLYKIFQKQHQVDQEVETLKENIKVDNGYQVDWDSLKASNPDIVAWIYVPDCNINFPVVQTSDNDYYLNHSFSGEYNDLGAIFLAAENKSDFSDQNSVIYGHSVEGIGGMFTDLKNYDDQTFFNEHTTIYLFTPDGNYKGNVLAFAQAEDGSEFYALSYENSDEHIQKIKSLSEYTNDISTDGHLLTLSTCNLNYGLYSLQRYVLVTVLEPTDEPIVIE